MTDSKTPTPGQKPTSPRPRFLHERIDDPLTELLERARRARVVEEGEPERELDLWPDASGDD